MNTVLKKDHYSYFDPTYCYGKKGDELVVISNHDSTLVVENKRTGERFGVPTDKVKFQIDLIT